MAVKSIGIRELMKPSSKQQMALDTIIRKKFTLYGGAMYGGKSYLIRWALLALLVYYFKKYGFRNVQAGLFCEDYPTLKQRQLSKIAAEFPKWLGTRHSDHKDYGNCFILDEKYGSGVLMFLNLDRPEKYDSAEFAAIGVDELTKNPYEIFPVLRRRLRWTDRKTQRSIPDCRFIAGTNPGGVGHTWVKKLFIDGIHDENEVEADEFAYVHAKYSDNIIKNESYESTLNSMPEKMRRAFRDGDWDIFEGQFFGNEWGQEWNVCKPFKIPDYWRRFISLDYGYSAPSSVHWWAISTEGRLYAYRELYGPGMTYKKLGRTILAATPEEERDKVEFIVADPAIFAKSGHLQDDDGLPRSGADELSEGLNGKWVVTRANNDRVNGWGIMRQYMAPIDWNGQKTSRLIYFDTCKNAIRTIPALVHDDTRPEDVNTKGEDHAGDESRYAVMAVHDEDRSDVPPKPKGPRTADDVFRDDMLYLKRKAEEESGNVDWMNI
jgi:phage terminase large subunit